MNDISRLILYRFPADEWLQTERNHLQSIVESVFASPTCSVLLLPHGYETVNVADGLRDVFWDFGFSQEMFEFPWSEVPAGSPEEILNEIVGKDSVLRAEAKPLIVLYYDDNFRMRQEFSFSAWAQYLKKIHNLKERRKLVVILLFDASHVELSEMKQLPDPFSIRYWPASDSNEMMVYVKQALNKKLAGTNPVVLSFLTLRTLDYCMQFKFDAEIVIKYLEYLTNAQEDIIEKYENFSWTEVEQCLKRKIVHLPDVRNAFTTSFLQKVMDQGGIIPNRSLKPEEYLMCLRLWQYGLATYPESPFTPVLISSRGIEEFRKLAAANQHAGGVFNFLQGQDNVASHIIAKCLQIERMLKRKVISNCETNASLMLNLQSLMTRQYREQLSVREYIQKYKPQFYCQETKDEDDLALIKYASMSLFLRLYRDLFQCNSQRWRDWEEKIVEIRNCLAHGQNANWKMYSEFVALERQFISSETI